MATFSDNDPRQPANRCHTIYLAATAVVGFDSKIPHDQWRSMLLIGTGSLTPRQLENYTEAMEHLLMLTRHGREGVQLRRDGFDLLTAS